MIINLQCCRVCQSHFTFWSKDAHKNIHFVCIKLCVPVYTFPRKFPRHLFPLFSTNGKHHYRYQSTRIHISQSILTRHTLFPYYVMQLMLNVQQNFHVSTSMPKYQERFIILSFLIFYFDPFSIFQFFSLLALLAFYGFLIQKNQTWFKKG